MSGKKKLICDLDADLMACFSKTAKANGDSMTKIVGMLIEQFITNAAWMYPRFTAADKAKWASMKHAKKIKPFTRRAS